MKKRTIISLIITIISIIATNKLWLIFEPIPVSFYMKGNGEYTVTVILNKKDDDKFKKVKKASKQITLSNGEQKVNVDVIRSKFPKRLKLVMLNSEGAAETFSIRDLYINKQKIEIKDINTFSVKNAKIKIDKNKLIITPINREKVEISYKPSLNVSCHINFEFLTFISIIILSFLLFYKLSSYVADFKNIQNQSRIEIIFLTVFFIFLFIPMSNIDTGEKSKQENRTLAKWQSFITESGKINYSFGKNFDEWFNDRFYLRSFFINISSICTSKLNLSKVIIGQDGWLFLKWDNVYKDYANLNLFTESELKLIVKNLEDINNYCEKNNKKFVLFIAPVKYSIYGEYYPGYIKKNVRNKTSRTVQLINYIKQNSNIKVIYPYNELVANKNNELLYYKTDSHWNYNGAYVGFLALMKSLKCDSDIELDERETKPRVRDLDRVYNNKINDKKIYKEFITEKCYIEKSFEDEYSKIPKSDIRHDRRTFNRKAGNNQTVVIYRDSFVNALLPFLSNSFKEVFFLRRVSIEKKYIDKGDIIIYEIVERGLPTLKDLNEDWKYKI